MLKRGLSTDYGYCKFAIMNPELTYTLPAYQTASGCTDIMVHTLERYFTAPATHQLALIDGIAETLLRNVMRYAKIALKEPDITMHAPKSCGAVPCRTMKPPVTAPLETGPATS